MNRNISIRRVAILGIIGNILLLIAKLAIGLTTKSQSMIADGMNSAGDVFASVMTYVGNHISAQPVDEDHPYGHGKAEYIFSMIISFSLVLVAFSIFRSSLNALITGNTFTYSIGLVLVALGTILVKFLLFLYANRVGHDYNSLLAMANAEDHRNDMFITGLTLVSIACGYFGIYIIDGIGGIIIAFWIAFSGFKIFTSAYEVLMDTNIDQQLMDDLSDIIEEIDGVDHIDAISAKPVGLNFLLIVKVSIDAHITVYEGHGIAHKVRKLLEALDNVEEVVVHVNPAQFHPERMTRKHSDN